MKVICVSVSNHDHVKVKFTQISQKSVWFDKFCLDIFGIDWNAEIVLSRCFWGINLVKPTVNCNKRKFPACIVKALVYELLN